MNSLARVDGETLRASYGDHASAVRLHDLPEGSSQSGLSLTFDGVVPVAPCLSPQRRCQLLLKRVIDIVLSLAALLAFAPVLILAALAIAATSPGPIIFRQIREGVNGTSFKAYKFCSMKPDMCDATGLAQTHSGDVRVTQIGRFLRKTSIDELPQLVNVIKGDMSLVGPRPHVHGMLAGGTAYKILVPYYDYRLFMKPGMTGWAQANGLRGPTNDAAKARARIDHDIAYIQNFSVLLDLRILVITVLREFITGQAD